MTSPEFIKSVILASNSEGARSLSFAKRPSRASALVFLAIFCLASVFGCSGGMSSGESQKFEGGGPIPEINTSKLQPEQPSPARKGAR